MAGHQHALMTVLASGLLVVLGGCSAPEPTPEPVVVVDLLKQDWQHTPGVTADGGRLQVAATARSIVEQDGGGGQPNPPLNLAGAHLVADGDFSLTASFTAVTADASWTVYDGPPVIADEFRIEPAGLRLTLRGNDLGIAVFDGSPQKDVTNPQPAHDEHVQVSDPRAPLTVRRSGDRLEVGSGGDTVSSLPLGRVFESGKLWLGLSSDGGSFQVTSLTASAPEGTTLTTAGPAVAGVEPLADGLQALAARTRPDFRIGAAVALGPLASDPDYGRALVGNFGALTPENAMKPQSLSPQQGVYTFEEADAIIAIAESKGMTVHGHTIAFTEAMPRWMQELPSGTDSERRSSATALLDCCAHGGDALQGTARLARRRQRAVRRRPGNQLPAEHLVPQLRTRVPAVVSQAVYEADPGVKQFINENGADVPGDRQDALLKLALDTNARGGHLYGVGLQAHIYDFTTDAIPAEELSASLATFEAAGLRCASPRTTSRTATGRTPRRSSTPRCWPRVCARVPASPTRYGAWTTATTG